ncbi:TPA: hypothetical protein RGJ92_003330 [Cronobacter sakazakii]|nr:hypothetical protein [Cronobacter sakazakii]
MSEVATELSEEAWPSFYPKGVPPKSAEDAEGEFYRLVKASPPTPECFLSTHEEYPNRYKKCSGEALQCVYGTSFFSEERGAKDAKAKFPAALGNRLIAKGEVQPHMGKMKKTFADPAHFTLWLRVNSAIHEYFACTGDSV